MTGGGLQATQDVFCPNTCTRPMRGRTELCSTGRRNTQVTLKQVVFHVMFWLKLDQTYAMAINEAPTLLWLEKIEFDEAAGITFLPRYTAMRRVRGYYGTAQDYVKDKDIARDVKDLLNNTLKQFEKRLKVNRYYEAYFDRQAEEADRLCNASGWFSCQGKFNESECQVRHTIDPYANKAARLMFTTWNLDHQWVDWWKCCAFRFCQWSWSDDIMGCDIMRGPWTWGVLPVFSVYMDKKVYTLPVLNINLL